VHADIVLDICKPVIIGDYYALQTQVRLGNLPFNISTYRDIHEVDWNLDTVPLIDLGIFTKDNYHIGQIDAVNGRAAIAFASKAISLGKSDLVDAVVAAPHTQSSIAKAGIKFDGYPAFVATESSMDPDDIVMMLCFDNVRIAHCTLHVSVKAALDLITTERVKKTIRIVYETLIKMGIPSPRIMVSGINPHAGENRLFGNEDADQLIPAIESSKSEGINVYGPIGADTMFHTDNIDAFVVMLHDQGHIPAKLLARHRTIAMSIGGPVIFSSVAHGSALDIAGKGIADPAAIIETLKLVSHK